MGHPCCNEKDCKEPLAKVTDEYCHKHLDNGMLCCVKDCCMPREVGFRTCCIREHRLEEHTRKTRGRKTKTKPRQQKEIGVQGSGSSSVKGAFSRRWTHNEQLVVRPCGIVIGRGTCYAAESMPAVKVLIRSIFPENLPGLEPEVLFFDNACGLRAHIKACRDFKLLERMAIVVDAFHFSGHKISHEDCQRNCSPHEYPVLKKEDGSWLFNSSAAEQVNSWFGKFQGRVKEMNVVR